MAVRAPLSPTNDPLTAIRLAIQAMLSEPLPSGQALRDALHAACAQHEAVRRGLLDHGDAGGTRPIHLALIALSFTAIARSIQPFEAQRASRLAVLAISAARAYCLPFSAARTLVLELGATGLLDATLLLAVAPPLHPDLSAEKSQLADGFRARAERESLQTLCRTLIARGVAVSSGRSGGVGAGLLALDCALLRAASAEARAQHAAGRLTPSCVKSGAAGQPAQYTDGARRGDLIRWLDGAQPALPALSALTQWLRSELLEAVRDACAQAPIGTNSGAGAAPVLRLERPGGLAPAMLACYPGQGAHFERHLDNSPATPDARVVTAVVYLNPDWSPADGGVLRLYPLAGPAEDVEPTLGALALFWSHRVEHEVLPARTPRYALSLWMSVAPDQPVGWLDTG